MNTKQYNGTVLLSVSGNDISVPYEIMHEELERDADVIVKIRYLDAEYEGKGGTLDWADAFADLQKKLPSDTKIKCCMTCRYGNLCPYGCIPNLILCSAATNIQNKDDWVSYLDAVEMDTIRREVAQICEKFVFAEKPHYTYNDYLYYLER